ncbi:unnamed protein product, partial [Mesorhabditis spiculigera]
MSPLLAATLIFGVLPAVWGIKTDLCTPTSIVFRGADYIKTGKGQLVLISFMPLQCPRCRQQLERLSALATTNHGVRVAVLAPHFENYGIIGKVQTEFPRVLIDRDVDSTYEKLGVQEHEIAIFDKCGRMAHVITAARSDLGQFSDTIDTLKSAQSHAICGWCSYGKAADAGVEPRKVDVWLKAQSQRQREEEERRSGTNRPVAPGYSPSKSGSYQARPTQPYARPPAPTQHQNYRQREEQRQPMANGHTQSRPQPTNEAKRDEGFQQVREEPTVTWQTSPKHVAKPQKKAEVSTTVPSKYQEADYDYFLGTSNSGPTEMPAQTQIPKPSLQPWWASPPPTFAITPEPVRNFEMMGEENIPCSAYTDDVCYHQQEKIGAEHISKCCTKRIYFTDLCVPGKCSNSTIQLCCMQKFLQARFACCQDESQSDGDTPTDKFSRCCYESFSQEDDCCPKHAAKTYWESANELCFPNTKVRLEKIRLEVRFSEGVRVIDLGENRLWDHECPHGAARQQYAYVP